MKNEVFGFLGIEQLLLFFTGQFFKSRKVFIFLTFLGFSIIWSHGVSAQNKSEPPDLPAEAQSRTIKDHPKADKETRAEEAGIGEKRKGLALKPDVNTEPFNNWERETYLRDFNFQNRETSRLKVLSDDLTNNGGLFDINKLNVFQSHAEKNDESENSDQSGKQFLKCIGDDLSSVSCYRHRTGGAFFPGAEDAADDTRNKSAKRAGEGFQWRSAIGQSLLFLAVQHGYAFTQEKTRRELKGNFFRDYVKSVKSLRGWDDGGRFFTNYIAHPMQGSFTGFIQIHNDPKGKHQRFGTSAGYWQSRMKAMVWSAAWSTQFEIGPISQASIGNVGLKGKQTYVDLVITPTVGTAMLITEDAIDRFLIERIEGKTKNYYLMIFSRVFLNPTRTMANLIRFKIPWYRDRPRGY